MSRDNQRSVSGSSVTGIIHLRTSQFSDLTEIQKQYDHSKVDLSFVLSGNRPEKDFLACESEQLHKKRFLVCIYCCFPELQLDREASAIHYQRGAEPAVCFYIARRVDYSMARWRR